VALNQLQELAHLVGFCQSTLPGLDVHHSIDIRALVQVM
jgi:hypothetical protein